MNVIKKVEYSNGRKEWWLNGKRHREDGPAIEYASGDKAWCLNGKRHREDGPAIEYINGYKEWWLNGKLHREDGPAVEYVNGDKAWWLNGKPYTEDEFKAKMNSCIDKIIVIDGIKYKLIPVSSVTSQDIWFILYT